MLNDAADIFIKSINTGLAKQSQFPTNILIIEDKERERKGVEPKIKDSCTRAKSSNFTISLPTCVGTVHSSFSLKKKERKYCTTLRVHCTCVQQTRTKHES